LEDNGEKMKLNFEQKTRLGLIGTLFLIILTMILIIKLGQQITILQEIEYNQQINACMKDTYIDCFPTTLHTGRTITCKCKDGTTKRVNYYGELI
jgi:hypothetical protein